MSAGLVIYWPGEDCGNVRLNEEEVDEAESCMRSSNQTIFCFLACRGMTLVWD